MKRLLCLILFTIFSIQIVVSQNTNPVKVDINDLRNYITFLSSDSLKGRKPGTKEFEVAAFYIKDLFKKAGLKLIMDDGFQYFNIISSAKTGDKNKLVYENLSGTLNQDFIPFAFTSNTSLSAKVAFAGYGFDIETDTFKWNDYQGIDVKNKWVFILRDIPEIKKNTTLFEKFSRERAKITTAKDKGAAGVIFISGFFYDKKDRLTQLYIDQSISDAGIPVLQMKREFANKILSKAGKNIEDIEKTIKQDVEPVSFEIEGIINATTDIILTKIKTENVIGMIVGNDPVLKNEYIVIGAHFDHLGYGGNGSGSGKPDTIAIHHGADDNASGTAGILELAKLLVSNRSNLKRSIIFVAFSSEEIGLIGSKYFVKHSPIDLKKIDIMLNYDMIGRLNPDSKTLVVNGSGTSMEGESILKKYSENHNLVLKLSPDGFGGSDQSSFYSEKITVFFFFTGVHDDYHMPSDEVSKINFEGEKSVLEYNYDLIMDIANRDKALTYKEAGVSRDNEKRKFKVTLGIIPDYTSSEENGLKVDGVKKGGPAYIGGIKKNDIIISLDDLPVKNIYDYMYRLEKLEPGQTVKVEVIREGKSQILHLLL